VATGWSSERSKPRSAEGERDLSKPSKKKKSPLGHLVGGRRPGQKGKPRESLGGGRRVRKFERSGKGPKEAPQRRRWQGKGGVKRILKGPGAQCSIPRWVGKKERTQNYLRASDREALLGLWFKTHILKKRLHERKKERVTQQKKEFSDF